MPGRRWIVLALLAPSAPLMLPALGCGKLSTTDKLSGSDCKPRKLVSTTSCAGEDRSFQECSFYHRAIGTPQRSWCEAMPSAAPAGGALSRCSWDSTIGWTPVTCNTYNIHGAARCFACTAGGPEEALSYVFAYDAACRRGLEQVTCNADPAQAGLKLGPVSF